MKKITVLVFMSLMAMVSLAQDIIITTEKEKIDAKVVEVSSSTVRYKKTSSLDGATYVLETDKVVCVAYENGDVDLFAPVTNTSISSLDSLNTATLGFIAKEDDIYTLYTKKSRTPMDRKAYKMFIQNNSPEAWKEWKKGTAIMNTGWGLFAGGLASTFFIGVPLINYYYDHFVRNEHMYGAACAFLVIGPIATITSIPLLSVGANKRKNSYTNYNQQTAAQFTLGCSSNGVGLQITF